MIKEKRNRIGKLPVVEELISHLLIAPRLSYLVKKRTAFNLHFYNMFFLAFLHINKAK